MWRFLLSEKKVMMGLIENADRTDAQIADAYGMNKGTVASVRRRLVESGAVYFVNVPSFNKLGCELMASHIGATDPAADADVKTNNYIEFCEQSPNVFHGMIGGGNVQFFTVFRNATDLEAFHQSHSKFFSGTRRQFKAELETTLFPYALTRGSFTTNFAPIAYRFFQLETPPPEAKPWIMGEVSEPDLSENERHALLELVANPLYSDRQLASEIGLSRQAVTRIRRKLFDEGYLKRACIPRLYKWGFEIYAVTHSKFNMDMRWDIRLKSQPKDTTALSFFTLSKADESVANYMVSKYQEYAENLESLLGWFHKAKAFDESPRVTVFSLERSAELRSFDFLPAVRSLLQEA
jgi:DNA-binding Lrp family transcriptional regulator